MHHINNLRERLNAVNLTSTKRLDFTDMSEIVKVLHKLELSANKSDGVSAISEDKIVTAIKAFAARNSIKSMPEARLLSYGCTLEMKDGYILIEDEVGFNILISYLDQNKSSTRQFRKCYRGLLYGYFTYNIQSIKSKQSGVKSWNRLKSYLSNNSEKIETSGFNPEWVPAIIDNTNLFGDQPCAKYGLKALYGDTTDFDMLKVKLEISSNSWLFEQFINAQIDAGVRLSDDKFKLVISPLLNILSENVVLQDGGLAKIINRYFSNDNLGTNNQLKDYVISLWKNPWLNTHSSKWALISPHAKQKIEEWLKLELITLFFSLLAEDGLNNPRRVNFWKKHHQKISEMYFVVAQNASFRYSNDFKKMKSSMEGRLLDMIGSSTSAFVMRIGNYYFIEFGQINNATYIYKAGNLPLDFNHVKRTTINELKNKSLANDRLAHNDVMHGYTKWEDRFENEIRTRISGSKSNSPLSVTNTVRSGANTSHFQAEPVRTSSIRDRDKDNSIYIRLLSDNRFRVDDLRSKGGSLWLTPKVAITLDDVRALESIGFTWSSVKNGYYRS